MEKSFKVLGGLIEFKYVTGPDVENLSDEDLMELNDELEHLKEKIEKRIQVEKKPKKKETDPGFVNDCDIPYEVRMKHIINAYRKDQEKWGKLEGYAKHLEAEVIRLKNILIVNGYTDSGVVGDSKPSKVIAELREENNKLREKNKELKSNLKEIKKRFGDPERKIMVLENKIAHEYPEKVYRNTCFKQVIKSQELYIEELQKLLEENNIPYPPQIPTNELEAVGADSIDVKAVR